MPALAFMDNRRFPVHVNLLVGEVNAQQVILPFIGRNVPGIATIVNAVRVTAPLATGLRHSFTEWEVQLGTSIEAWSWEYRPTSSFYTWEQVLLSLRTAAKAQDVTTELSDLALERYVRTHHFPLAQWLDATTRSIKSVGAVTLLQALTDQQQATAKMQFYTATEFPLTPAQQIKEHLRQEAIKVLTASCM